MLYLRAGFSDKLNCDYSIFITFKYNPSYVELVKSMPKRVWNGDNKEWEVAYECYSQLIGTLNAYNIPYNAGQFMQSIKELQNEVQKLQTIQKQEANVDASILDNVEFKTTPYPYQKEGIAYGLQVDNFLNADDQGLGKALSLDTKILTNTGWKLLKDIQIGDSLFDEQGNPCSVTNIFDHDCKNMYKVTFSDNTTITCCDEHLWSVYTTNDRKRKVPNRVMQLKEIQKDYLQKYNYKYYIPMVQPVNFDEKDLNIPPYLMGVLLGDGCLMHHLSFTSADEFIVNKVKSLLKDGYELYCKPHNHQIDYSIRKTMNNKDYQNFYIKELKQLKLHNCNSHNKFIPDVYKYSNVEDRLQLLQGLMDTDGYIAKVGTMQFTSVSEKLIDDVGELIHSLGGTFSKRHKIIQNKFEAWELTIKLKSGMYPVSLPRKLDRVVKNRKYEPIRMIKKIEYIGQQPARCLTVDSDSHLFVIENFIVTHNTLQCINIARLKRGGQHCLVIVGYDALQFNWVKEIGIHSNETAKVLGQKLNRKGRYVAGSVKERLEDLQNLDKTEEFFIVTTVTTLRQCIKTKYVDKNGKTKTHKDFYMADLIEHWCRKGVIGRIIYDEIQTCKNYDVDQTQALLRLKSCAYKIAATGTPIMNKNIDLYPIMTWLGYEKRNYWEFRDRYCKMGGFKGKQIVGDKNNPELHAKLSQFMIRRKKEDVLDLPPKVIIDEVLDIDGKQYALYDKYQRLAKQQLTQMKGNKVALLAALLNLRKITTHPAWCDENIKDSVKFERARQIVYEAVENNRKCIIFSNWATPITLLYKELEMYNPAMIIGDTQDRMAQVEKFQNDDSCKVILGTIGAMGTGLTLTAASNVIFIDEPWNRALKDQATDRAYRIGTKYSVNVYTLICKDTVDEMVHNTVYKKGRIADEIVDGVTTEELEKMIDGTL